jgi:5-hydroxyisourate hydrolase
MSVANPTDGAGPIGSNGAEAKRTGEPDRESTGQPEPDLTGRPEPSSTGPAEAVPSPIDPRRPTISTHVLDTGSGRPAAAVHVTLYKLGEDDRPIRLSQALTDADGRIADLLDRPLSPGVYRIEFNVRRPGGPGSKQDVEGARAAPTLSPFFERLAVDLRVDDTSRGYHVPVLLSPYSLTTYRGS